MIQNFKYKTIARLTNSKAEVSNSTCLGLLEAVSGCEWVAQSRREGIPSGVVLTEILPTELTWQLHLIVRKTAIGVMREGRGVQVQSLRMPRLLLRL